MRASAYSDSILSCHRWFRNPQKRAWKHGLSGCGLYTVLALRILKFFVPGHLDGFELSLVRFGRVVGEAGQLGDVAVQIGEAYCQRVGVGVRFGEENAQIFAVGPG